MDFKEMDQCSTIKASLISNQARILREILISIVTVAPRNLAIEMLVYLEAASERPYLARPDQMFLPDRMFLVSKCHP
jgi:hypothetical protein